MDVEGEEMSEVMEKVEKVKWVKREVKCEVGKGKGEWLLVKINGKKFVMKEVGKFWFER